MRRRFLRIARDNAWFFYGSDFFAHGGCLGRAVIRDLDSRGQGLPVRPLRSAHRYAFRLRRASRVPESGPGELTAGVRVRVRTGVLAGVEGTVLRRLGGMRILVSLHSQARIAMAIDDRLVERIG